MAGEYGIGLGISQGLDKVSDALVRKQELQFKAEQQEQNRQQFTQQQQAGEMQNQILQKKLSDLEAAYTKQTTFQAFDAFEASKDSKYLNLALSDSPKLKSMMDKMGYSSFSNLKDFSPEKLASLNYKEDEFVRPVVVNTADGKQKVIELFGVYGTSGYLQRANEQVITDYETKVNALKVKQKEAELSVTESEANNYLAYVDAQIASGKMPMSQKEFGKNGGLPEEKSATDIKTQTQAAFVLSSLQTKIDNGEELTVEEQNQHKQLTKLLSTDSDEKKETLSQGLDTVQKYTGGNLATTEVSLEDVKTVQAMETLTGTKPDKTTLQTLTSNFVTLKQGYKLVDKVNELKDEELEKGLVDEGMLALKKVLSDTNFEGMDAEGKAKALKTVKFNTRLGSYLADYIRSISGTAASEAEFSRLKTVLTGGQFNNTQTMRAAIQEFVSLEDEKFAESMSAKYSLAQGDILNLKYMYQKEVRDARKGTPPPPTGVTKEQALAEIARRKALK